MSPTASGTGDGKSPDNSAAYQLNPLGNPLAINHWLNNSGDLEKDVTINFKAGTYVIPASGAGGWGWIQIAGSSSRIVTLNGIPDAATGQLPTLRLESSTPDLYYDGQWNNGIINRFVVQCAKNPSTFKRDYLKKIVISNMELDGNFQEIPGQAGTGHGAITSEANTAGFRSMPIDVAAQTGLIQNVVIRNFGSIGEVPANPNLQNDSGVESFMVSVHTFIESESYPTHGATPLIPWIIEKVEVRDFHSIHGGYGTMIMPHAYQTTWGSANANPYILVRQCMVMGSIGVVALGTAGKELPVVPNLHTSRQTSGRIVFKDNVVVNASHGINIDTGLVGPVVFENNAFLDVGTLGSFGASGGAAWHKSFKFKDNLIRLRGYLIQKSWADICLRDGIGSITDPNLALGRWVPNDSLSDGLFIEGEAAGFQFEGNDFSTWPLDNYDLYPAGVNTKPSQYQLIWKVPDDPGLGICGMQVATRGPVTIVSMTGNRVSKRAYDFGRVEDPVGSVPNNNFESLAPRTTTIDDFSGDTEPHVSIRTPVDDGNILLDPGVAFKPKGQLKRVVPIYSQATDPRLIGVREVQIGEVTYAAGELTVRGRMVEHRLRPAVLNNLNQIKTMNVAAQFRLRASWTDTAGQNQTQSTFADANSGNMFIASPKVTGLSGQSGVMRLQLWKDEAASPSGEIGVASTLNADVDAWAEWDFPLAPPSDSSWAGWIGKPSVEITATPDVGDDKNSSAGKRAKIRLRRHGSTVGSLPVRLSLDHTAITRPGTTPPQSLRALYGSPSGDYTLAPVSGTGTWAADASQPSNATLGTATIANGQSELILEVVPVADNLTEYNLIEARILTDPQQNPPRYASGILKMARVLLFDGPLWTVLPLEGWALPSQTSSSGAAVNAGVVSSTGVWTVPPQIVGRVSWPGAAHGGLWTTQSATLSTVLGDNFHPYGISFRQDTSTRAKVVGERLGTAYRILDDNTGGVTLPHFTGSSGPSVAWGISPDGVRTVGYSIHPVTGKRRPAHWTGTAIPTDLSVNLEDPQNERIGEAKAVNNAGVVVGYSSGFGFGGFSLKRPFRTAAGGAALTDTDYLLVPAGGGGEGTANSVATSGGKHHAVGQFKLLTPRYLGARWTPTGTQTLPSVAANLDVLYRSGTGDFESEAKCINSSLKAVGWSGPSSTSPHRRAVIYNGEWQDLNDQHFIHASSGWTLQSAEAISDNNVIVGVGTLSGTQKGFILVPRVNGN
ncbi:MAG: hypothetical protein J0L84_07190 [Verrucomicrobia bacterium]|nr:hypothetical protein [Verrucomicrobiota bacterium]